MQFYEITAKEALDRAATNESGLTEIEAQRRLLEYGPNTLKKQKKAAKPRKNLKRSCFRIRGECPIFCRLNSHGGIK